jgi:hypothetical protein
MHSSDVDQELDPPAAEIAATGRRRRWRMWTSLGAALVLVIGGCVTAVALPFHYLHAPRLEAFGVGWLPPDNRHFRFVQAGPYSAEVVPARPGQMQTFSVEVQNPSSVTQTVLGLAYDTSQTAEPERLTVSTVDTGVGDAMLAHYTSKPVSIPPRGVRTLRLTRHTAGCSQWGKGNSRSEYYTELQLRVRVGAFTRTERVTFDDTVLELRGTSPPC